MNFACRIGRYAPISSVAGMAFAFAVLLAGLAALAIPAHASEVVAIGASNTNGKGVGRSKAWPGQLQAMLKQRGRNVRVANQGVNGNTTSQMLRRLPSAIRPNTKVAVIALPLTNDRRSGVNTAANVSAMQSILKKRGVRYVIIDRPHQWAGRNMQSDGIHFTVAGHANVAAKLVPKVLPLLN